MEDKDDQMRYGRPSSPFDDDFYEDMMPSPCLDSLRMANERRRQRDEMYRGRLSESRYKMPSAKVDHDGVAEVLLRHGADVNRKDLKGRTPLMCAVRSGNTSMVENLCKYNADVNLADNRQWTALMFAALRGHLKVVRILCRQGSDVNAGNRSGNTALMSASRKGHERVVEFLCGQPDCDVKAKSHKGWTALHWAASNGHLKVVQKLLIAKANINETDNEGTTPLQIAKRKGRKEVATLLEAAQKRKPNAKITFMNVTANINININNIEYICVDEDEKNGGAVVEDGTGEIEDANESAGADAASTNESNDTASVARVPSRAQRQRAYMQAPNLAAASAAAADGGAAAEDPSAVAGPDPAGPNPGGPSPRQRAARGGQVFHDDGGAAGGAEEPAPADIIDPVIPRPQPTRQVPQRQPPPVQPPTVQHPPVQPPPLQPPPLQPRRRPEVLCNCNALRGNAQEQPLPAQLNRRLEGLLADQAMQANFDPEEEEEEDDDEHRDNANEGALVPRNANPPKLNKVAENAQKLVMAFLESSGALQPEVTTDDEDGEGGFCERHITVTIDINYTVHKNAPWDLEAINRDRQLARNTIVAPDAAPAGVADDAGSSLDEVL